MNSHRDEPAAAAADGWSGTARRVAARLVQFATSRFELFAFEFDEERRSTLALLGLLVGAAMAGFFGLALAIGAVLLALPEDYRAAAAAAFALAFGIAAGVLGWMARRRLRDRQPPFSATVNELKRDREWLETLE